MKNRKQMGIDCKKSQAALEFLTTYAWAFIVILVTLGSLYYFGVFDYSKFVPEKCTFPPQFTCTDFSLSETKVSLRMTNTLGERINITSAVITDDSATPFACSNPAIPNPVLDPIGLVWSSGTVLDLNFTSCSGGAVIGGERIETRVKIDYYAIASPSKTLHTIQGKISGTVLST